MRQLSMLTMVLAALWLGPSACTPDFEDEWEVKDLRILAIQADPPELLVSTLALTSTDFPPVGIKALVVDPRLDPTGTREWLLQACTPEGTTCDDASLRTTLADKTTSLDQIEATFKASPELLRAALQQDRYKGFGGVAIHLHLKVWDPELDFPVEAIKRVVYGVKDFPVQVTPEPGTLAGACRGTTTDRFPSGADCDTGLKCNTTTRKCERLPNRNPTIGDLTADEKPIPLTGWEVPLGTEIELLPEPGNGDDQSYWVNTFTGGTRQLQEYLSYAFLVTSGKLSQANTGGRPSFIVTVKSVEDLSSKWTPQVEGDATLWVVVRDDRGGVSWTSRLAKVTPATQ